LDFLNHRERGIGFLSGFPPFSFTETVRGCVSLAKWKSQGKTAEVTVNSKEEQNLEFCLAFDRELGLCTSLKITSIRNSIIIIIFYSYSKVKYC
jgi:hypothetical protein